MTKPVDDLELFELITLMYPERFASMEENEAWDAVPEFVDGELQGLDAICDLLGRVAMLAPPMASAITGKATHALGAIEMHDGAPCMVAVVTRPFKAPKND